MARFPNYIQVEVAEGVTAKVTPLRLGWEKAPEAIALISGAIPEGELFVIGQKIALILEALTRSLSENHTQEEVRCIIDGLPGDVTAGSALFRMCLALIGMDASVIDKPEADGEAEAGSE